MQSRRTALEQAAGRSHGPARDRIGGTDTTTARSWSHHARFIGDGRHAVVTPRPAAPFIPLFWRLFVPNAAVLLGAGVVLMIQPANGRVVVLAGGLAVMLTVNLVLMRRAFAPLVRLASLMNAIDPLDPGRRLPALGPASEVTRFTDAFNAMLDRLETERRESGYRALVAEEAERRRVAAELHDEIGQRLTALLLQIDRLSRAAPPELGDEFASTLRRHQGDARGRARTRAAAAARGARRARSRSRAAQPLRPHRGGHRHRRSGARWTRICRRSTADAELVVYRVAQEALTNVVRHSGVDQAHVGLAARGANWSWSSTTTASASQTTRPRIRRAGSGGCVNVPC